MYAIRDRNKNLIYLSSSKTEILEKFETNTELINFNDYDQNHPEYCKVLGIDGILFPTESELNKQYIERELKKKFPQIQTEITNDRIYGSFPLTENEFPILRIEVFLVDPQNNSKFNNKFKLCACIKFKKYKYYCNVQKYLTLDSVPSIKEIVNLVCKTLDANDTKYSNYEFQKFVYSIDPYALLHKTAQWTGHKNFFDVLVPEIKKEIQPLYDLQDIGL